VGRADRRIMLKQAMAEVSRSGMDLRAPSGDQSWQVIAATRILIDVLKGHSPMRASKAAEKAHEFFETSIKRNATGATIECAKGCAFCCYVAVSALAPEIFLIANTIRAQYASDFEARSARIHAVERATHGLGGYERAQRKLPCALLDNNTCSVYGARPGPCRGVTSASVRACQAAFNGAAVSIPTPMVWSTLRNAEVQAMMAALTAVELPAESYELNEAVCLALDNPDAELRWLKGEDVFAGVSTLRIGIDNPAVTENNRRVIAQLIAGALGKEFPGGG
jgi:Fe-S-cluster containining protein